MMGEKTPDFYKQRYFMLRDLLWDLTLHGNLLVSTMAAGIIRQVKIEGPNGQDPGEA